MYLCYADDSGDDDGRTITALLIPVQSWTTLLGGWLAARAELSETWGVKKHAELHSYDLFANRGRYCETLEQEKRFGPPSRRRAFALAMKRLGQIEGLVTFTVATDLVTMADVYEIFLRHVQHWAEAHSTHVMVIYDGMDAFDTNPDETIEQHRRDRRAALGNARPLRKVHRNLDLGTRRIIEDVVMQDSKVSQLIQAADMASYAAFQFAKEQYPGSWVHDEPVTAAARTHHWLASTWPEDADEGLYVVRP
ncbi:MAG TPA: DUF3800 domain-containing protein [Arthrobacter sp.]|nr:DUF3800 domain-containing protein [Arthrobacter sp.]